MMGVWHCALDTIEGEPIPVRDTIGDICTVLFLYYRRHTILPAMIVFSGLSSIGLISIKLQSTALAHVG